MYCYLFISFPSSSIYNFQLVFVSVSFAFSHSVILLRCNGNCWCSLFAVSHHAIASGFFPFIFGFSSFIFPFPFSFLHSSRLPHILFHSCHVLQSKVWCTLTYAGCFIDRLSVRKVFVLHTEHFDSMWLKPFDLMWTSGFTTTIEKWITLYRQF